MTTGTWPFGFATGDVMNAAQYGKGIGAIFDTTLGGSAATIDITGIVGTYAHLWLVVYGRGDAGATFSTLLARFNADSTASYDAQVLQGQAATVTAAETFAQTAMQIGNIPAGTAPANLFGSSVGFVPHYSGSSNNKATVTLSSLKLGTSTTLLTVALFGGFWRSSSAINRITLFPGAGNFVAGTRVSLYALGA